MSISRVFDNSKSNENCPLDYPGDVIDSEQVVISLPLRVIYTLNFSTQPLLARVKRKSPAMRISKDEIPDQTNAKPSFAKVHLKTCLAAVCASSPELLGNPARDYSIYIIDPLESISGLSAGVGLLSWWLKNDRSPFCNDGDVDNDYAVGKIVMDRGTESLEIVMSLRETTPQSAEDHARSLSSLCLPPLHSSQAKDNDTPSPHPLHLKHSTQDVIKTRVGRPSGASTNPEKKARRVALLEQKETLKRLQNLAKMQRGEPYDGTLILSSDVIPPKVTQEDIERQQKIVNDLESRPPRHTTSLLTTKPLPNRSTNLSMPPKNRPYTGFRQPNGENSLLACNTNNNSDRTSSTQTATSVSHPGTVQNIELLYSLFTTMLSGASAKPSPKGKETESTASIDPAVIASLAQLLPFLTARLGLPTNGHNFTPSVMFQPQDHQPWNHGTAFSGFLSNASQRLFQTADETFRISNTSSPQLTAHVPSNVTTYGYAKSDPPKVREDAHPVPGGGWARGRNLVPRTPLGSTTADQQLEQSSTNLDSYSDAITGKENKPPLNVSQGTKRGSAALLEKESNFPKNNCKKRKAEKSSHTDVKAIGIRRTNSAAVSVTQKADSLISHAASSPLRPSNSQNRTSSEPDFQGSSAPLIATSDFPFPEAPRTPPPKNTINFVEKSLFTPATPTVKITAHTDEICTGASLFTPSPVLAGSQEKLAEKRSILHSAAIDSEPFTIQPGWDLPPSSPLPPTSPVSSPAGLIIEDRLETPSRETGRKENTKENETGQVANFLESLPSSTLSSEFGELSEGDRSETRKSSQPSPSDDIELDIEELWNSLGPIIVQAQIENVGMASSSDGDLNSDYNISHVVTESQNGIDAAKLAEDLKALFGGCIV